MKTLILLLISTASFLSCTNYYDLEAPYTGESYVIDLPYVSGLELQSNRDIIVTSHGSHPYIAVHGSGIDPSTLRYDIVGDKLCIYHIRRSGAIQVNIPDLQFIGNFSSGDITVDDMVHARTIEVLTRSSGDIRLPVDTDLLIATTESSGDIIARGFATNIDFITRGSGDIRAHDLTADYGDLRTHSSGDIRAYVRNRTNASIFGSGDIYIRGNSRVYIQDHGSGQVYF